MPCAAISPAPSMTAAAWSSAFEGMQPTLRHTPPSVGYRSTSTVRSPRSAARNAAVYPPGPAPSTTTSALMSASRDGAGAGAEPPSGADVPPASGSPPDCESIEAPSVRAFVLELASASASPLSASIAPDCVKAASGAMITSGAPSDTVSPTVTRIDSTVPTCGEGTSMAALSLSSVTRGVSMSILSPGETSTSMTGTSLNSPMSGTRTVIGSFILGIIGIFMCAAPSDAWQLTADAVHPRPRRSRRMRPLSVLLRRAPPLRSACDDGLRPIWVRAALDRRTCPCPVFLECQRRPSPR